MVETLTKYFYQIALDSRGQPYLDAQEQLVNLGEPAITFLNEQLPATTGLQRLITEVLLEVVGGNENFKKALEYLDEVEQYTAGTVVQVPPPEPVAEYLFRHFKDSVASLLGVYLVKLSDLWPEWKILGVILYLGKLSSATSALPLTRFLSTATNDHQKSIAFGALVSVGDANALAIVENELKSAGRSFQTLQQAADQIRAKLP